MERQYALILLGAEATDDDEQLLECLEEAVFTLANYFMRREFIPALAAVKRKKLEKLTEAAEVLTIDSNERGENCGQLSSDITPKMADQKFLSLLGILEYYHKQEAQIKHKLANSLSPWTAAQIYAAWESLYLDFGSLFCSQYEMDYGKLEVDSNVKLNENFDYSLLKAELLDKSSDAHQLHRYYSRLRKILTDQ